MELKRIRALLGIGAIAGASAFHASALLGEDNSTSTSGSIRQVLAQECSGKLIDRREHLKELDTEAARWQAGEVKRDGKWLGPDELRYSSRHELEYEQLRGKLDDDINSHRKLAKWCQKNDLASQARAHWNAVIEQSPNDLEARRALRHQWIDGVWFTEQELQAAAQTSRERVADLKQWSGQLVKILKDLSSGNSQQKQSAIRKLKQFDEPGCIASLELGALQSEHDVAKLLIDQISQHRSTTACTALTRIALADPHSARGIYATQKLKEYDQGFVVPELLGLLNTPIETRLKYDFNQRGELLVERVLFRETNERREMVQFQRLVRTNSLGTVTTDEVRRRHGPGSQLRALEDSLRTPINTLFDEQAAQSLAMQDQAHFDRQIAEFNRSEELRSQDVSYLLSEVTNQPANLTPEQWWKWWQDKNYRPQKPKPLTTRQYQQVDRPLLTVYEPVPRMTDCLVAGTLVQTSTGNRPIETLSRGDLVLSQNVETGQVDLKAIVRVVPRAPAKIVCIQTENDQVRSTQGHRWWVAGKGWVMAADLEVGMNLHTASGTVRITEVREDAEQPTFNLVVDEYHTYFVGKDRVLSFDNIEPRPTLKKVPGFDEIVTSSK